MALNSNDLHSLMQRDSVEKEHGYLETAIHDGVYGDHSSVSWGSWGKHLYHRVTGDLDIGFSWGSAYSSSVVIFGSGNDKIYGNIGNDRIYGNGGHDLIRGGAGDDEIIGGSGNDVIYGDAGNDFLYGGDGNDTIYAGDGGSQRYYGTKVFPRIGLSDKYYGDGNDFLSGGDGDDTLIDLGSGNNIFIGGSGFDKIHLGSGQNTVIIEPSVSENYFGYDFVTGFTEDDVITFIQLTQNDHQLNFETIREAFGVYVVEENGGTTIYAERANGPDEIIAFLSGFTGFTLKNFGIQEPSVEFDLPSVFVPSDRQTPEPEPTGITVSPVKTTEKQTGDVTQSVSKTETVTPEPKTETVKTSTKVDLPAKTKVFEDSQNVAVPADKPAADPVVKQTETSTVTGIIGTDENDDLVGTSGRDLIAALDGADWVRAGAGNDVVHGDDGDDNLYGELGDDTLFGGAGNDNLRGGFGNDTLIGGDGTDSGFFEYTRTGASHKELTADLKLKANSGREFKKTPEGGKEELTFYRFWVDVNNNGKKDDGDEYDYYTGIENFAIRGGAGNDKISGADGTDDIQGRGGNDKLNGKGGHDRLDGGAGRDKLNGGDGNDILIGGAGRDKLIGGKGDDEFHIGDLASSLKLADVIKDYGNGNDVLKFGAGVTTVYVRNTGKDTILQNGGGDDAEIYAILRGYTDPLDVYDAANVEFIDII